MSHLPRSWSSGSPDRAGVLEGHVVDDVRRDVLWSLEHSEGETVYLDEVSEQIVATLDSPMEAGQTNIQHKDLPKLVRAGLVEYDERSGAIRSRNSGFILKLRELGLLDCTTQFDP